jgi:methionyl-tRNA formyltransferase
MRLVFFGSGAFGLPTLERLLVEHDVELVVTQPDRPARRGRALTPTPIGARAAEARLPVITPERVNEPEAIARIRTVGADAWVVIAYGHKLGPTLLEGVFAINLHASLLPKYRGAAPINWAMIEGETETGVSVITLAHAMDAGDVLARRAAPIDPMETAGELHDRLADIGVGAVLDTLERHAAGTLEAEPQAKDAVSLAPKLRKADGVVSFDQPAARVRCRVHGLTPWPGCTVTIGDERLKLLRVEEVEAPPDAGPPGTVHDDATVACAPGAVRLLAVQPPGGRSMSFAAYCRGRAVPAGARITLP